MASSLGSSVLDLGVNSSGLESGLQKAEGTTKSRMEKMGGLIGKAAKAAAASFVAAGAAAVTAAFQTAKYGDEVAKTAPKLGITTDALQEMNYWAARNGIESSTLERAVGTLNTRIGQAASGNDKYAESFQTLGVALTDADGKVRSTEDVMSDLITALKDVEDPALRSAMAADILGDRVARELMPALQDGSLSLEEAAAKARELGLVMDADALQAAERFQDTWADIKDQIGAFIREAAIPLMTFMADVVFPAISDGIAVLRRLFDAFREGETALDGFGKAASLIGDGMGALFGRLLEAAQSIFGRIVDWLLSGGLEAILNAVLAGRERLFDAAMRLFPVVLDALVKLVPQVIDFVANTMVPRLLDEVVRAVPMLLDAALTLFRSLVDAVLLVLPGLVQTLFGEVLPTVLQTVLEMAPDILDAALEAFFALLDAVLILLPELIDILFNEVLPAVVLTILDMLPQLLEAAITAFFALVQAIVAVLPDILRMLFGTVLPAIVRTLFQMMPGLFQAAVTLFREMIRGILSLVGTILSTVGQIGRDIIGAITGIAGRMFEAGKNIIRSLIDGIRSMIGNVKDAMGDIAGRIRNFLPFSPAKEGPLSGGGSPDRSGQKIADMVADGILAGEQDVALAMRRITHMDVDVSAVAGRGLAMDRMAGAGIVVNVEGAIDPENTARTILRTLRDAERRTGDRLRF